MKEAGKEIGMFSSNHSQAPRNHSIRLPRKRALLAFLLAGVAFPSCLQAQVRISLQDQFSETGLYYRAYVNNFNPRDLTGGTAYVVPPGLVGSAGPDQFWDFSNGPTDKVFRFDYLEPEGQPQASRFVGATVAERKTDESNGSQEWLYFTPLAGNGRRVLGFYAENGLFTPWNVFVPPIVDFPDPINYGDEWSASTSFENTVTFNDPGDDGEDPGGLFDIAQRVTVTSTFKADAYGTILLPDELDAFGPGLRINEQVTYDIAVDLGEGFEHVETDYTRNFYWMMPGRGIVAQLSSTQSASPPPEEFPRATAFVRMFETNKKPTPGGEPCTSPQPVKDFRLRVSSGVILLTWGKAECANQYVVQYTETPADSASWQPLGNPTTSLIWQGENLANGKARFYRVVSMP